MVGQKGGWERGLGESKVKTHSRLKLEHNSDVMIRESKYQVKQLDYKDIVSYFPYIFLSTGFFNWLILPFI